MLSVLKKYVILCMACVLLPVFAEASVGFVIYLCLKAPQNFRSKGIFTMKLSPAFQLRLVNNKPARTTSMCFSLF